MSGHAAANAINVGSELEQLPASRAALERGEIGLAHLSLIAATAKAVRKVRGSNFDERRLARLAKRHLVSRFRTDCAHIRHAAHERAYLLEQKEVVDARQLHLSPKENGCLELTGFLDPEGGALLRTALEPLAERKGLGDGRLRERRLADALVELAEHKLDQAEVPRQGGEQPHLQVTCVLETLQGRHHPGGARRALPGARRGPDPAAGHPGPAQGPQSPRRRLRLARL